MCVIYYYRDFPNGCDIGIHIYKNDDKYFLLHGMKGGAFDSNTYKTHMRELKLHIRKVQPNNAVLAANEAKLLKTNAIFPFQNWTMCEANLNAGAKHFTTGTLFAGRVPSKSIYVLVEQGAYKGNVRKNPTLFKNWGVTNFKQKIDGLVAPIDEHVFDWAGDNVRDPYRSVFENSGIGSMNRSNLVTLEAYKNHRFMVVYDNSADGLNFGQYRDKKQLGNVTVELSFKENLPAFLALLCFGITDDYTRMDEFRSLRINE